MKRINEILEPIVGRGNLRAQVAAAPAALAVGGGMLMAGTGAGGSGAIGAGNARRLGRRRDV